MARIFIVLLLISILLLAGCAVGPQFKPPQPELPAAWTGAQSVPADDSALATWWTAFADPQLTALVETAIAGNLDLRLAQSRIRQARATFGVSASALGPSFDTTASARRSQTSADLPAISHFQTGFDAAWEIDLFGGTRRSVEAADADLQNSVESRRDILVTLTAEVARNYIELRGLQEQLAIARRNLHAQNQTASLTEKRRQSGLAGALDAANAATQAATTAAQIPTLESAICQSIYALSVLCGQEPAALLNTLAAPASIPVVPPAVPAGIPAGLHRRRPDISAAETAIHAATARIGVAIADLFPKITLTGALNWQAENTGSLFDPTGRSWSIGPSITWPIFQSGRIRSNIEVQKALQEQSVITYRQTVLSALQEVEDALIASAKHQERRAALTDALAASRKAVELATTLYREGESDFLNVLTAQRALFSAEAALAQNTQDLATTLVSLCKALGGGWTTPSPT